MGRAARNSHTLMTWLFARFWPCDLTNINLESMHPFVCHDAGPSLRIFGFTCHSTVIAFHFISFGCIPTHRADHIDNVGAPPVAGVFYPAAYLLQNALSHSGPQ